MESKKKIRIVVQKWIPIEGLPKPTNGSRSKNCNSNTLFAKKRANHRNLLLKDLANYLEPNILQKVPEDYISPFEINKCAYCLSSKKKGSSGAFCDEFRATSQHGRMNKVNCIPCCGTCNISKGDKSGSELIKWIKEKEQIQNKTKDKIINWYHQYEKYMIIPIDTIDIETKISYNVLFNGLDNKLDIMFKMMEW